MRRMRSILFIVVLTTVFSGCAIHSSQAKLVPNANSIVKKNFYVIHSNGDKRNLHEQIADILVQKGFNATSGKKEDIPSIVDVLVTYEDRWMWDLSNYLIQLDIQFRNAKNEYPFVVGETIRTSLIRKNPSAMAEETINQMLEKMNKGI